MTKPRLLGGRYELDGIVGRGGMAEVFRARDIRLDRIVGVKALRDELARDQTFQARFQREAQSAASLNHPSIVAVYDTGEESVGGTPVPYIVMEFVEGRTLRDLLRDDRGLLPERAAEITCGVLTALGYSHRHGIVHRDIKPGNVMLTPSGDVKVMDFGLARAVPGAQFTLTQTAQVMGTAQYLSPEQARGDRVDARSDLYSTGCLLYELLTGRPPFTGDSPVAIAYQHVMEDPVPPSRVDPEIPAWADAIVLKALQKDPARRYQSADEMRDDIQRALAGAPVAAPKRKAWRWATLAVVIVLLAVALGINFVTGSNNWVGVPTVAGMSLVKAENAITGVGLRIGKVSYTSSASVAKNDVISTNPSHGTQVSKRSAVNLAVSKGPAPVASHPRSRHSHSATPAPTTPSSPGTRTSSPSPSPTPTSPSPSTSCVVNILGICV
ncbi:MAG TPA: Stk1 family PASTA domain-containing Ser/Thr kinase [Streptosporangiaceae bacterium]|jgi:serine/threonine protein kinase